MRILSTTLLVVVIATPRGFNAQGSGQTEIDPRIQKLVASISEERLAGLVQKLAGFGTRHTLSDTESTTRGIGAARQWIFDELTRSSPKLQVSFDIHKLARQGRITRNVDLRNIVALLPGKSSRRIYVTAHYDTVNIGEEGQISANTRAPSNTPRPDPQLRRGTKFSHELIPADLRFQQIFQHCLFSRPAVPTTTMCPVSAAFSGMHCTSARRGS